MAEPPKFLRLFIALAVPEVVKARISEQQQEFISRISKQAVRWTPSAQFHLTLRFLGQVPETDVETLHGRLKEIGTEFKPFRVSAAGMGIFPNARRPRVLWVGLQAERLAELQRRVQEGTAEFGSEPPEDRPFQGHITLGRVKEITRQEGSVLAEAVDALREHSFGEWQVDSIDLMRSELGPQGARHTNLHRISFGS